VARNASWGANHEGATKRSPKNIKTTSRAERKYKKGEAKTGKGSPMMGNRVGRTEQLAKPQFNKEERRGFSGVI